MSVALTMPAESLASAHRQFEAALPAMDRTIRYLLRRYPRRRREEALAEARAYTWAACHGLLERGRDIAAVGLVAIAANSCRAVKNGRSVGAGRATGQGAMDALDPRALRRLGVRVIPLGGRAVGLPGTWEDWLATKGRYGPSDDAAFRIDFAAWLAGLPTTKRRIAELLAAGLDGLVVARTVRCSPGRVSQVRSELAASWRAFQGQAEGGPRRAAVPTA